MYTDEEQTSVGVNSIIALFTLYICGIYVYIIELSYNKVIAYNKTNNSVCFP